MSILNINNMFSALRMRMEWSRAQMLDHVHVDETTLARTERGNSNPRVKTVGKLMYAVRSSRTISFSYLQDQTFETYELCEALEKSLEREETDIAVSLLGQLEERSGMDLPLNRHYYLSQKTRLMLLQGAEGGDIMPLVMEGLDITEFDHADFMNSPLMHQEPLLLLVMAQVHGLMGDPAAAINLLKDIDYGIKSYPYDDRTKERVVAPVLLALARIQLAVRDYDGALATCTEGMDVSVKWCQGRICPDFLLVKTLVEYSMGGETGGESFHSKLVTVYAGFLTLGNMAKAKAVKDTARDVFGITLELHGIDDAAALTLSREPRVSRLPKDLPVHNLGETIRVLRKAAGLTLKELSEGICGFTTLSRIESGETEMPDFYTVEALTQRLGVDIVRYHTFYLAKKEFEGYVTREKVRVLLRHRKYGEAEALLAELRNRTDYKKGVNLQFIKSAEATIYGETHDNDPVHLEMLRDALKMTIPKFDERNIAKYHLSLCESVLINQIAGHYLKNKIMRQSAKVYEDLLNSITAHWKDELFLEKMFATVCFNYSTCLGRMNEREESLMIAEKGIAFELWHSRLVTMGELFFNKAYNKKNLTDKKKESLSLFVLSFYLLSIFSDYGRKGHIEIAKKFIFDEYCVGL